MVLFYSSRSEPQDRLRAPRSAPGSPGGRQEMLGCESHRPGHQMHYVHQGQALRSPSRRAASIVVDGHAVVIAFDSGERLEWFHHDPDRLTSVLGLFPTSRVVYDGFHALRVGPYWFNCAVGDFVPCASLGETAEVP
jgi:hypothetical protein